MSTENTKSPLKETKYNRATYTGLGADMQDRLIKGAYLSARADAPDYSWMNAVSSGINAFGEAMETKKANKKAEHEEIMGQIQTNVDEIYAAGGSMPQEYFDQAYTYTEQLREEYYKAVQSGDTKAQHQLKGKLNAFSTGIQNTKKSLEEGATLIKDGVLINDEGLTTDQKNIMNSIKKGNAELDMESGSYRWKAVDVNGKPMLDENGQQKYYTEEDYSNALVMRDDVNKEAYLSANSGIIDAKEKYENGKGPAFDNTTSRKANIKIIDASIKENGNMQSMIWDDITGFGSFADTVETHPEFVKYFDEDLEYFNMKDGLTNNVAIALYDKDKDGHVGYEDFISAEEYPDYDTNKDGVITADELEAIYAVNPTAKETVSKLAKEKIKHAILNPAKGQEDLTKGMLADFMTNRQSQMFYGEPKDMVEVDDGKGNKIKVPKYTQIIPGKGNVTFNKKKGILKIGSIEINSIKTLKDAGGNYGFLMENGYTYDDHNDEWIFNEAFEGGTYIDTTKKKYDE